MPEATIRDVAARLPETFKDDFALCLSNVQEFARRQRDWITEFTEPGAAGCREFQ